MPCHPERVRNNNPEDRAIVCSPVCLSSGVDTTVIKSIERDVQAILSFMDMQYTNDDLRQAMKRLRRWVGY